MCYTFSFPMEQVRLAKFIAQTGYAARRKAEELILAGGVTVNGNPATTVTTFINPDVDRVEIFGQPCTKPEHNLYIALHKPSGYLSTTTGDSRKKVPDLLPKEATEGRRLFLVGRLDKETEGLIVLTDDGDFAQRLMHPSFEKEKEYEVIVRGRMDEKAATTLRNGVDIIVEGKPYHTYPAKVEHLTSDGKTSRFHITLGEGKKRQIRLMCAAVGHPVRYLRRVRIGSLELGDLPLGKYRLLSEQERQGLMKNAA